MKKNKLLLALLIGTCLVGCTAQNKGPKDPDKVTTPPIVDKKEEPVIENYFGQISSIAGNEINVSLADLPKDEVETSKPNPDGSIAAVPMQPANMGGSDDTKGASERDDLAFTGEKQDFIIPTGVSIKDKTYSDVKIDALKKGSIVLIEYDATNKKVLSVTISA